jgi:hypothetical protein
MRQLEMAALLASLALTCGCISTHLVKEKVQRHPEYSLEEQELKDVDGQPGYYALLPLTIVGDIATSPAQVLYLLWTTDSASGLATINGAPIPLK